VDRSRRFAGKTAVITGAGNGLGKAVALRLCEEGASRVACLDLSREAAEATATEIRDNGGQALAVEVDISNEKSVDGAVKEALAWCGGFDILGNIAGIGLPASTLSLSFEEWSRTIAVNLTGPFLMSRACLPSLIERKGNIVNVASVAGLRGSAFQAAYNASKGGVVMLTKSLALEFASKGVRVNCVCPGGIDTAFAEGYRSRLASGSIDIDVFMKRAWSPLGKSLADPSEITNVIAFLASSEASFMTGSAVVVDGGNTA